MNTPHKYPWCWKEFWAWRNEIDPKPKTMTADGQAAMTRAHHLMTQAVNSGISNGQCVGQSALVSNLLGGGISP